MGQENCPYPARHLSFESVGWRDEEEAGGDEGIALEAGMEFTPDFLVFCKK